MQEIAFENAEWNQVRLTLILDGCARTELGDLRWGSTLVERAQAGVDSVPLVPCGHGARVLRLDRPVRLSVRVCSPVPAVVMRSPQLFLHGLMAARGARGTLRTVTCKPFPEGADERPWMNAVRDALHKDYNRPLRMRAIAREVGIHPVHVSRGFTQRFGVTMTHYLRDLRVMRAAELIVTTDQSLSRIAQNTGFSDHAHFTRVFAATIGCSPSAFRRIGAMDSLVVPPDMVDAGPGLAMPA